MPGPGGFDLEHHYVSEFAFHANRFSKAWKFITNGASHHVGGPLEY